MSSLNPFDSGLVILVSSRRLGRLFFFRRNGWRYNRLIGLVWIWVSVTTRRQWLGATTSIIKFGLTSGTWFLT